MRQIPPCYVASNRRYAFQVHGKMPYRVVQIQITTNSDGQPKEIGLFITKRAAINAANRLAATRITRKTKLGTRRRIKV